MSDRLKYIKKKKDNFLRKKYYKNIEYPSIPVSLNDIYIVSKAGDRLDLLAYDFYKDPDLWWIISRANPNKIKRDSLFLNPGLQIRIPFKGNIQNIYEKFEELNKK